MYKVIMSHLQLNSDDPVIVSEAKDNCLQYFVETMVESNMLTDIHKMAMFLHPSFKRLNKMTAMEKAHIMNEVREH